MTSSLEKRLEAAEEEVRADPKRGPCVAILLPLSPAANATKIADLVKAQAEGRLTIRIDLRMAEERSPS